MRRFYFFSLFITVTSIPNTSRRVSLISSYVEKLIPTAIGPFIQFILSPLKNPFLIPSSLEINKLVLINCRRGLNTFHSLVDLSERNHYRIVGIWTTVRFHCRRLHSPSHDIQGIARCLPYDACTGSKGKRNHSTRLLPRRSF